MKTNTRPRQPRTFRDVVDNASRDPVYAAELKRIAARAKTGNPKAVADFTVAFKLTPKALKALGPAGVPQVFLTSIPCTIVVATTFLSCFPRTSYGDHWFCKTAE